MIVHGQFAGVVSQGQLKNMMNVFTKANFLEMTNSKKKARRRENWNCLERTLWAQPRRWRWRASDSRGKPLGQVKSQNSKCTYEQGTLFCTQHRSKRSFVMLMAGHCPLPQEYLLQCVFNRPFELIFFAIRVKQRKCRVLPGDASRIQAMRIQTHLSILCVVFERHS